MIDRISLKYMLHVARPVVVEYDRPVHYDVFLSYCPEDSTVAEDLLKHFEAQKLSVFIPDIHLLPGVSQLSVTAELIYER